MSVRTRSIGALLLLAWLSTTGAFGACEFFKPADPEPPRGSAIIPDYSSPTKALETVARGVADKNASNGQSVYILAFGDSATDGRAFHAFFDLADFLSHPSRDRNIDWTRDLERDFYGRLVQVYSSPYEMTWAPYEPAGNESGTDRDSLLHRKYNVMRVVGSNKVPIATGAADLYFVKSATTSSRWVIARWQDYHTADADSARITLGSRRLD